MKKIISIIVLICLTCTFVNVCPLNLFAKEPPPREHCEHGTHPEYQFDTYEELYFYFSRYKCEVGDTDCYYIRSIREIQKKMEVYIPLMDGEKAEIVSANLMPSGYNDGYFWIAYRLNIPFVTINIAYLDDELNDYARHTSMREFVRLANIGSNNWDYEGDIIFNGQKVNALFDEPKKQDGIMYRITNVGFVIDNIFVVVTDESGLFYNEYFTNFSMGTHNFLEETTETHENSMFSVLSRNITKDEKNEFFANEMIAKVFNCSYNYTDMEIFNNLSDMEGLIETGNFTSECFFCVSENGSLMKIYDKCEPELDYIKVVGDTVVCNNMYRFLNSEAVINVRDETIVVNNAWLFGIDNFKEMIVCYETEKGVYVGVHSENAFNNPYIFSEDSFIKLMDKFCNDDRSIVHDTAEYKNSKKYTFTEFLSLPPVPVEEEIWYNIVELIVICGVSAVILAVGVACFVVGKRRLKTEEKV